MRSLRSLLEKMPVMAWIMECSRLMQPKSCGLPRPDDEVERRRYSRCLDHVLTTLDVNFADRPVSLHRVLDWLRLQIATNVSEDEPVDAEELEGKTTSLTVHKSKGLEFDQVLVPNTWSPFDSSAVVKPSDRDRSPNFWAAATDLEVDVAGGSLTNVRAADQHLWREELTETVKEETRLLYVALTRARRDLVVFTTRTAKRTANPQTWGTL
jgi:DNA helicase-2/ATP-dependent DNA helicase PcrA